MHFIGDVHEEFDRYLKIVKKLPASIQLGDMGVGFRDPFPKVSARHKFLRGNHDNPFECQKLQNYLGDFGVDRKTGIFYLSGAFSIDRACRVEGWTWWLEEELDERQAAKALRLYTKTKPAVVASHTCPETIVPKVVKAVGYKDTATGHLMDAMLNIWRPELWVFAHFHTSKDFEFQGTRFVCLNELEVREL